MKKALFFLLILSVISNVVMAQKVNVTGRVDDESGISLPGVNVFNVNTQKGTVTDKDGNYSIEAEKGQELQFSYIGMQPVIVIVEQSTINVVLKSDDKMLDEVVAIGYGTSTKKDLTGSVASVKIEDSPAMEAPSTNVLESLKGSLPGVTIGQTTSAGGTPFINIRGNNSISAGNSPLLVVDGIVGGSFSEINPKDIAKIDILKDASSAAVYGSRAANGVIIITTKRGKSAKPQVRLNINYGINKWTRKPNMMNGEQYLKYRQDFYRAQGKTGSDLEPQNFLKPKEWDAVQAGSEIDWFNETTNHNSTIQDYQVSISGADKLYNYYVSFNHVKNDGILIGDSFTRNSVLAKLEMNVNDYVKTGVNISANIRDYSGVGPSMYNATYVGPYGFLNSTEPGYEKWIERYPGGNTTWSNPLWNSFGLDDKDKRQRAKINSFIEVKLPWISGLKWRVNASYNVGQSQQARFYHPERFVNTLKVQDMKDPDKFLNRANGYSKVSNSTSWLMNQILSYNKAFGDHKIDVTLMSERMASDDNSVYASGSDFEQAGTTVLGFNSLEMGNKDKRGVNTSKGRTSQLAYMGRVNYVFNSRYHASFSIRRDGFSAFSEGYKFGNFKAGALAWTMSEEDFIQNDILTYLKLRLSYGENGNPSIGRYSTFPTVGSGGYLFGQTYMKSLYQNKLANKTLGWERTEALNIGVDFAFLNGRFSGNIDYYKSKTKDLLITRRLPVTSGYSSILDNMGELENRGIEISLHSTNIETKDFSWKTDLSFWLNRNKIVSLYGIDADGDGKEDDDLSNSWFIGEPLSAIYNYETDGIVQEDDTEYINKYNFKPGDIKIVDINKDDKINGEDRTIIGYSNPRFRMNLRNTLNYKNFMLYLDFAYVDGGNNHYLKSNEKGFNPNKMPNANWINEEYWTPENKSNVSPRANYTNSRGYGFYQSREFLRLQNISLTYTFDKSLLEKTNFFSDAKIFVTGKNLFTITDWRGLDPEAGQRIGEGSPSFKTYSVGINLSF